MRAAHARLGRRPVIKTPSSIEGCAECGKNRDLCDKHQSLLKKAEHKFWKRNPNASVTESELHLQRWAVKQATLKKYAVILPNGPKLVAGCPNCELSKHFCKRHRKLCQDSKSSCRRNHPNASIPEQEEYLKRWAVHQSNAIQRANARRDKV